MSALHLGGDRELGDAMTLTSDGSSHCGTLVKSSDLQASVSSTVGGWEGVKLESFESVKYVERVSFSKHR